jgi:hypothetical protein
VVRLSSFDALGDQIGLANDHLSLPDRSDINHAAI